MKLKGSKRESFWYTSRSCVGILQTEMLANSKNLSQFARCACRYSKRVPRNTKPDPAYRVHTTQLTAIQNSKNTNSKYLQVFRKYMKILRLRQMFYLLIHKKMYHRNWQVLPGLNNQPVSKEKYFGNLKFCCTLVSP